MAPPRRERQRREGEECVEGVSVLCVWSVSPALSYVHDLAHGLNILMKETSETMEHKITYLVDQRHADTSGSSSKAPGGKTKRETG